MNRPLTAELIRARTKSDNLHYVKRFTLCGHDLDDLRILRQMPNLEILSLSVNKINSLKEFANCCRLQELYVRKNNINDLAEVYYLADLEDLRVLWLCENPCSDNNKYYREFVINALPNLETLDKVPITAEERAAAARLNLDIQEPQQRVQTSTESPPQRKSNNVDYESNKYNKQSGGGRYENADNYRGNYNPSPYEEANEYQQYQNEVPKDDRDNYRVLYLKLSFFLIYYSPVQVPQKDTIKETHRLKM